MKQWCLLSEWAHDALSHPNFSGKEWQEWLQNTHVCEATRTPKNTKPFCGYCDREILGDNDRIINHSKAWFSMNGHLYDGLTNDKLRAEKRKTSSQKSAYHNQPTASGPAPSPSGSSTSGGTSAKEMKTGTHVPPPPPPPSRPQVLLKPKLQVNPDPNFITKVVKLISVATDNNLISRYETAIKTGVLPDDLDPDKKDKKSVDVKEEPTEEKKSMESEILGKDIPGEAEYPKGVSLLDHMIVQANCETHGEVRLMAPRLSKNLLMERTAALSARMTNRKGKKVQFGGLYTSQEMKEPPPYGLIMECLGYNGDVPSMHDTLKWRFQRICHDIDVLTSVSNAEFCTDANELEADFLVNMVMAYAGYSMASSLIAPLKRSPPETVELMRKAAQDQDDADREQADLQRSPSLSSSPTDQPIPHGESGSSEPKKVTEPSAASAPASASTTVASSSMEVAPAAVAADVGDDGKKDAEISPPRSIRRSRPRSPSRRRSPSPSSSTESSGARERREKRRKRSKSNRRRCD